MKKESSNADKMTLDFCAVVCKILKISVPKVEVNPHAMKTRTQIAAITNEGVIIKSNTFSMDIGFAIAHELLHKYQIENNRFPLSNYKTVGSVDTDEYNQQNEEIDANAFAAIVMKALFGVQPLFNNCSETVKHNIQVRMTEIENAVYNRIYEVLFPI